MAQPPPTAMDSFQWLQFLSINVSSEERLNNGDDVTEEK